ncbi:ABC transporter substrate-binding protein [Cellulomonas chengniuliangii]|uniref:ABC transporter substrate-binding protein n=1 Tax=Cellulomonas chengniuliangii TaxID=2968084 RepID=A0ABY5KZZ8_9CELL|nr:ABC transporter substrate-binding protein [Cellulomonas chengniuliangii]MCC2307492.1 ABC transporter substrate-binding protein [Cellulomonas chengniuliangii]UUI75734.1 ABC transporter substrate-binding protein [Cellulomonas chengniuliangii]
MKRSPRPLASVATAALLVAALAACGSAEAETTAADGSTLVKVGTLKGQPHLFHPHLYADRATDDITFEVVQFDTSPDIKNAVVSGNIDFGVTGVPSALSGAAAGQDVVVVAGAADGGSGIVGNADITSVKDLVGRTVGFPQGSSQEILLRLTLEANGIDIDDLTLVNLSFSDMASALASGKIDAFSSAELGPSIALQAGARQVVSPYDTPVGKVNIGLVTTQRLIDEDPQLVQSVVKTHVRATAYMVSNPDEWAAGVVEKYGLDAAVVETAIANIWPRWDLDDEYLAQVDALTEQMHALGYIESKPAAADVVDRTFVAAAKSS